MPFVIRRGWHQEKYIFVLLDGIVCADLSENISLVCWMALSIHSLLMSALSVHVVRLLFVFLLGISFYQNTTTMI
jgi:hypothetical protein